MSKELKRTAYLDGIMDAEHAVTIVFDIDEPRLVFLNGEQVIYADLPIDAANRLDDALDCFEDGGNYYKDGFEEIWCNGFTIKRRARLVSDNE